MMDEPGGGARRRKAVKLRDLVEKAMTPAQLAEAQRGEGGYLLRGNLEQRVIGFHQGP